MTKSEKVEACDSTESISTTQVSWKDTPTTSASLEINALILLKDWWRKCLIDSGTLIEVGAPVQYGKRFRFFLLGMVYGYRLPSYSEPAAMTALRACLYYKGSAVAPVVGW